MAVIFESRPSQRTLETTYDLITQHSRLTIQSNGDLWYESPCINDWHPGKGFWSLPFQARFTQRGRLLLLEQNNHLLNQVDLPPIPYPRTSLLPAGARMGQDGWVTEEEIQDEEGHPLEVVVKRMFSEITSLTGDGQFDGIRVIQKAGFTCTEPLAATSWLFIGERLQPGVEPLRANTSEFSSYHRLLHETVIRLMIEGEFPNNITIDPYFGSYALNPKATDDPRTKFIAFDPVKYYYDNLG